MDEAGIDEVFQEVRIRLWRTLGSGERISGAPASYVYRTAVSAAIDLIRRRRVRREESLDERLDSHPVTAVPDPARRLESDESLERLEHAIAELIASRRVVVRMHLAGYHLSEIALMLEWSEGKTRNLLYRGLADLRQLLSARGVEVDA